MFVKMKRCSDDKYVWFNPQHFTFVQQDGNNYVRVWDKRNEYTSCYAEGVVALVAGMKSVQIHYCDDAAWVNMSLVERIEQDRDNSLRLWFGTDDYVAVKEFDLE